MIKLFQIYLNYVLSRAEFYANLEVLKKNGIPSRLFKLHSLKILRIEKGKMRKQYHHLVSVDDSHLLDEKY